MTAREGNMEICRTAKTMSTEAKPAYRVSSTYATMHKLIY